MRLLEALCVAVTLYIKLACNLAVYWPRVTVCICDQVVVMCIQPAWWLMIDDWWLMPNDCVHNPETPCIYNFEVHALISINVCELSMILLHKQVFFQNLISQSLWIKFQPEQKIKLFLYSKSYWHYWTTVVLNKSTMTDNPFIA